MTWSAAAHLRTVKKDGPITAPVWAHHLFKMLTHCAAAWLVLAVFGGTLTHAAVFGGPVALLGVHVIYAIWPKLTHDPDKHTLADTVGDLLVDVSLASVVLVLALFADAHYGEGLGYFLTTVLSAALAVVYWAMLPHSRP